MRKILILLTILFISVNVVLGQSDYYIRKSQSYQREAEYYQKKADGYRREAAYYLKKAEVYQREVAYYTKRGDLNRAKTYSRYAENEMDKYETQLRYAAQADDKAAMYLRWAADALKKQQHIIDYGKTTFKSNNTCPQSTRGQVDKSGMPYVGHIMRVMAASRTMDEKIVGVLHDIVEDTDWTFDALLAEGFPMHIIDALRCVTKLADNEPQDEFIERVKTNPLAVAVKINDLTDNMDVCRYKELSDWDVKRLRKYLKAYQELTKD